MYTQKIENVNRPISIGQMFSVACLVKRDDKNKIISFCPVINHPHNDKENGQPEVHYHTDYRFIKIKENAEKGTGFDVVDDRFPFPEAARLEVGINGIIERHDLPIINETHHALTQPLFIRNSNFKNKCIIKGKCPHRGFDLSQEVPVDGVITCPLHNLKFDALSGKITSDCFKQLSDYRNAEIETKKMRRKNLLKVYSIKDGDVISNKKWNEISPCLSPTHQSYTSPIVSEQLNDEVKIIGYDMAIKQVFTADYLPKPLENQPKIKFKVLN